MNWALVSFILSLSIPSLGEVEKFTGYFGFLVYFLILVLFALYYKKFIVNFLNTITERQSRWLTFITFLAVLNIVLIVYPLAQSGFVGGGGDGDDELVLGAKELLQGHNPYYKRAYLGNDFTFLPGSLILAIPFVIINNIALYNIFWLLVLFIIAKFYIKDYRLTLLLIWFLIALSPAVQHQIIVSDERLPNSIYILTFILFMISSVSGSNGKLWHKLLSSSLLGIGFSSHLNFIFLVPIIFSYILQNSGWRTAIKYIGLTCFVFLLVTFPFHIYAISTSGFSTQISKIFQFRESLPIANTVMMLGCGVVTLLLTFQNMKDNYLILLKNCALLQAFFVIGYMILSAVQGGTVDLISLEYGVYFLVFGAFSSWIYLTKDIKNISAESLTVTSCNT